ncbi:MAG TPA: hypothetical protein VFL85_00130 [Candidatus Saccharimonadales bacterium]|nr:hypothetical protein [Candidatus Saccharimonadales bacterium]
MSTSTPASQNDGGASAIPDTWPGAFGAYKYSAKVIRTNIWPILGLLFVTWVAAVLPQTFDKEDPKRGAFQVLVQLFSVLLSAALIVAYLRGLHGRKVSFIDTIKEGAPHYLNILIVSILMTLIGFVSLLLLVIPFFFIMPRLVLTTYFVVDKRMDPVEAIKASWRTTEGNVGKVWGIIGATIAMALLMITIIGIPFAIYFLFMYAAAQAVLYGYLVKQPKTTAKA